MKLGRVSPPFRCFYNVDTRAPVDARVRIVGLRTLDTQCGFYRLLPYSSHRVQGSIHVRYVLRKISFVALRSE